MKETIMKKQNTTAPAYRRIFYFIAAALLSAAGVAAAAEKPLSGAEIRELLAGNTAHGVHYGKRTSQYFSAAGKTLWKGEGDEKPSAGEWKTKAQQYCSRFADYGNQWGCYDIVLDEAQGIYYFLGENFRAPFIIQDGNSMF